MRGIKLERFLPKNQQYQRKFLNWTNGSLIRLQKSDFYMKNQNNQLEKPNFCMLLSLPISPILKIQKIPLGMLILRQKSF